MAARIIGFVHPESEFQARELPLEVNDQLVMLVRFDELVLSCCSSADVTVLDEYSRFSEKYSMLTTSGTLPLCEALKVPSYRVLELLTQLVPCVGCRKGAEKMLLELQDTNHRALEPIYTTSNGQFTISSEIMYNKQITFKLLYIYGSKLDLLVEMLPANRKSKRCTLHSLDTQRARPSSGSWKDVYDAIDENCHCHITQVEFDELEKCLNNYLHKHRFCSECKNKVLRAFSLLTGDIDSSKEKGYCAALYSGIRTCHSDKHLHVEDNVDFLKNLIERAEPEFLGSRRERHAKTLDIAQEEVLTCLGICLYEKLHLMWQKLKATEQTYQILMFTGIEALRKNFELAVEQKQGFSNLERLCLELSEEERLKEEKREQKREKKRLRKKNKENKEAVRSEVEDIEDDEMEEEDITGKSSCLCVEDISVTVPTPTLGVLNDHQQQKSISDGGDAVRELGKKKLKKQKKRLEQKIEVEHEVERAVQEQEVRRAEFDIVEEEVEILCTCNMRWPGNGGGPGGKKSKKKGMNSYSKSCPMHSRRAATPTSTDTGRGHTYQSQQPVASANGKGKKWKKENKGDVGTVTAKPTPLLHEPCECDAAVIYEDEVFYKGKSQNCRRASGESSSSHVIHLPLQQHVVDTGYSSGRESSPDGCCSPALSLDMVDPDMVEVDTPQSCCNLSQLSDDNMHDHEEGSSSCSCSSSASSGIASITGGPGPGHYSHTNSHGAAARDTTSGYFTSTLESMLQHVDEAGECGIPQEEIRQFQANQQSLQYKRAELRRKLKERFRRMQAKGCPSTPAAGMSTRPSGGDRGDRLAASLSKLSL